ncbi:IclR family transcriptional regulator [Pararhodobacter sp.]|uniref:IclR family transcriptional regulator n=1 Tax=Pararhodobacter sp. TaxID=2127056 RepID=UPI002FE212A5
MIKSVEKAMRVLEALSQGNGPMRLRDVAAATDMTRTNAFRMLQTLRELGYVDQTEDGAQYSLTLRLFEIGARRRASDTLVQVAHPVLQRLSGLVPENVMLSMREGMTSVVVDRIESRAFVRTFAYLGARAPLHAVSGGKCILAFESDEVIAEAEKTLTRFTERTITDRARLREELAQIRDRGYATAYHEVNDAARGVAVPIRSRFGRVAAAISISGPMPGYSPDLVEEYVRHLKTHAAMIEEAWVEGWRQPVASVPRPSSA